MERHAPVDGMFRHPDQVCAAGVGTLAILVLTSWLFGVWELLALGQDYVPMAPSTAFLFLLLGSSLFLHRRFPESRSAERFVRLAGAVVLVVGLTVLVRPLLHGGVSVEWVPVPSPPLRGDIPVGRMSPLTAVAFVATALAQLLVSPPLGSRRPWRQVASLLVIAGMATGLVVLLSYAADAPLLYGGRTIPMAVPTALAFVLQAGALLHDCRDVWPFSLFGADATSPRAGGLMAKGPLATFIVLALAIGIAGFFYLAHQVQNSRQTVQRELLAIAELKTGQIAGWYAERRKDAEVALHNSIVQPQLRRYLTGASHAPSARTVGSWMDVRQKTGYRQLVLYGSDGFPRLWAPSNAQVPQREVQAVRVAIAAGEVVITDLHRPAGGRGLAISFWVPVGGEPASGTPATGVLLMEIDPQQFLYPLIRTWPTASDTAETLLVRREGDDVVFLNELRHSPQPALAVRIPVAAEKQLPAGMAVSGRKGVVEGVDYRGEPVLAAVSPVSGTPWFMVAKVDQDEIYAPLRDQAARNGIIILVLVVLSAFGVSLFWKQRDNQWLRQQLVVEQAKTRAEEDLRRLNEELEQRVALRTAQMEASNKELEAFAYSVSHDLRVPLRGMSGFAELLNKRARAKLDEKEFHYLEVIISSARSMGELIDDLLSFSRMGRSEMVRTAVDLQRLFEESRSSLAAEIGKREVVWQVNPLPAAHGDAAMLRLVFDNLLGNAVKFTRTRETAVIEVGWRRDEGTGEVIVHVRDNGVGFNMKYEEKLFGLFQRLHRVEEFEGTGVGLANVRRIVSRHGGRTWGEGSVDGGAAFYFSLPAQEV